MAINDSNMQQAEQQQQQQGTSWSFQGGGLFAAPIARGVGSEYYTKLKNALIEIYKNADPNVEIAILDLDNVAEPALAFSAMVIAMRRKDIKNSGVAYHTLVIEATGDRVSPAFETINNQQVEITRVTSDAMDEILMSKVLERVKKAYPGIVCYTTEGTVIPANFNIDDKTAVHKLALNVGVANNTELEVRLDTFKDVNLAVARNDSNLTINIGFNRQQIEDAVGSPVRSDVLINFNSRRNNQNNRTNSINAGDKETKISQLSGFIDLVWNPANPNGINNPWAPQQMQMQMSQKYAARLVVTDMVSNFSYTPASVLLSLVTALSLRDDNNWVQAFRPIQTGNEIDMNDIGALNIEANLSNEPAGVGTRIDTKSDSFKLEDLGQLVSALVQQGLMISLDCPEGGPQTWYLSVFAAAANGSDAACRIILNAANALTNGNFVKHFPTGTPMFTDLNNRVHLGTWTDRNGNKRDIRDIDHLAVCNLIGERNPQLIRDFSDTFLRTQYPLPLRLAARKKIISGLTNETAIFTGFAQRVTFTSAFMEALSRGIRECGLAVRVNTPLSGSDFNNQRGVGAFANAALMVPGQSFMNTGMMAYVPNYQYGVGQFRY